MSKVQTEQDKKATKGALPPGSAKSNGEPNTDTKGKDAMSHTKGGTTEGAGGGKKQERKH